jgi:hypothetical protein
MKNYGVINEDILNDKDLFREICQMIWFACDTLGSHGTSRENFAHDFLVEHSKKLIKYRKLTEKK